MHERKKKDGQRKDKKMERMHEAVAERHAKTAKEANPAERPDLPFRGGGSANDMPQGPSR